MKKFAPLLTLAAVAALGAVLLVANSVTGPTQQTVAATAATPSSAAVAPVAPPAPPPPPTPPPPVVVEKAFAGRSSGNEVTVAVAVSNGRICELTRVLDWGGANLDRALARTLNISADEAAAMKHGLSLSAREPGEDARAEKAREVVLRELHGFARQLVSSLHFYQSQPGALEIGEVVVTGGTSELPGLAPELGRLVGASVSVGNPLARVTLGKKVEINDQLGSLAVAIGLGIED